MASPAMPPTWRHGKRGHVRLCIWGGGLISKDEAIPEGVCARDVGD